MFFRRWPLWIQATLFTFAVILVSVSALAWANIRQQRLLLQSKEKERARILAESVAQALPRPLYSLDLMGVRAEIIPLARQEDILYAQVCGPDAEPLATAWHEVGVPGEAVSKEVVLQAIQERRTIIRRTSARLDVVAPVVFVDQVVGTLNIGFSHAPMREALMETARRTGAVTTAILVLSLMGIIGVTRYLSAPLEKLTVAAREVGRGNLDYQVPMGGTGELYTLSEAFQQMVKELRASYQELEERRQELEASLEEQRRLSETVRELSTPVVPLMEGVIALPLVGHIDQERGLQIRRALLEGIDRHRASLVLLDITGVAVVDAQVTEHLLRAIRAVRLLGAECLLTGVRPQVAKTLARQRITLEEVTTCRSLQEGITLALQRLGQWPPLVSQSSAPPRKLQGGLR